MPGVRDDQQVTGAAVPRYLPCREPDPATQNLNGGFSRILMLIEGRTCGQRDNRLPQHVLVPAEHRLGAAAAGCGTSPLGLLSGDGVQGKLLHASQFPGGCERRATQSEGRPDRLPSRRLTGTSPQRWLPRNERRWLARASESAAAPWM